MVRKPAENIYANGPNSEPDESEPVKGPTPSTEGAAPSWMLREEPAGGSAEPPTPEIAPLGGDMLAALIANLHIKIAVVTHYEGWRLDEADIANWTIICNYVAKQVKIKDLGLWVAVFAVGLSEISKFVGFTRWRKAEPLDLPTTVPQRPV